MRAVCSHNGMRIAPFTSLVNTSQPRPASRGSFARRFRAEYRRIEPSDLSKALTAISSLQLIQDFLQLRHARCRGLPSCQFRKRKRRIAVIIRWLQVESLPQSRATGPEANLFECATGISCPRRTIALAFLRARHWHACHIFNRSSRWNR